MIGASWAAKSDTSNDERLAARGMAIPFLVKCHMLRLW